MFSLRKWNKMSENLQEVKCRRHHLKIARLTWRLDSWVFIGSKWSTVNAVFTKCSWSTVLLVLTEAIADPWMSPSPRTRRKTRLIAHSWIQDRLEQQVKKLHVNEVQVSDMKGNLSWHGAQAIMRSPQEREMSVCTSWYRPLAVK